MEVFCGSEFWNSSKTWHTEDPDFTTCFQKTVLVWIPCAFLWIFSILEIVSMKYSMNRNIPWGVLNVSKLIFTGALILLTVIDVSMALRLRHSGHIFPVDYYTPLIKSISFVLACSLVIFNRKYGFQTSGVLFCFWLFLFILSIPQCRSELNRQSLRNENEIQIFWDEYNRVSFLIHFALTIIMFLLNLFADQEPSKTKYPRTKNTCPEISSTCVSKLFFSWFDSMAWKGYRNPLQQADLWDLKPEESTTEIIPLFTKHWEDSVRDSFQRNMKDETKKSQAEASIVAALCKSFGTQFVIASLLKLTEDVIAFVSPQLLGLTIQFVDSSKDENRPEFWKGLMYSVLLFVVASSRTLIFTQFYHRMYVIGFRIRTALSSAIYRKALIVSNAAKKDTTIGEIMNLMSIDADRFTDLLLYLNLIWSAPLQISLAVYFLWQILGVAVLAGLAVMIASMPLTGWLLNMIRKCETKEMAYKDDRIKMINEILNGIKVLKLYAWENSFRKQVLKIRGKEVKTLKRMAFLDSIAHLVWVAVPFFVSILTFGVFVLIDENNVLTPDIAFVALNLFNIIRFPLVMLPDLISNLVQTKVSIDRINKFLNSEELDEDNVQQYDEGSVALLIENGTFSWDGKEPILTGINMTVEKKQLVAVVGSVGAGKSSVLSACLGEMEKIGGRVNTVGKIAYVSQQAWIQNCTLRDNILFGKEYDEKFYKEVIRACALNPDIDILPGGDQTEIGEKGINLSGGQKQRISLARAVYSNADLYLLDDPLSSVDAHVGQHIFEEVIGTGGLLSTKTRVMVTHGITSLPKMNHIYVLKNGEVSESGSYDQLMCKRGAFAEFLIQHIQEDASGIPEIEDLKSQIENTLGIDEELAKKLDRSISRQSDTASDAHKLSRQTSEGSQKSSLENTIVTKGKDTLIDEEEVLVGSVKWEVYKHYMKSVGFKWMILMIGANVVFHGFNIASNLWLSRWSTDPNAGTNTQLRDLYLLIYGLFGLSIAVSGFLLEISPRLGGLVAGVKLHKQLLAGILRAPLSLFETTPTGRILTRFSKDIDTVDNSLPSEVSNVFGLSFEVTSTLVVISISTHMFLIVVIPIGILYYILQQIFVATSRQLKRMESISRSPIYSHFGETLQGAHTIRAYGVQNRFIAESDNRIDLNQSCQFADIIANQWLAIRLEMIGNLIILFAAMFAVQNRDSINAGIAGLSIAYALQITESLNWLVRSISEIETETVAVERIKQYAQVNSEAEWDIPSQTLPVNWPEAGTVQFKNFQVRYREGLELVLRGISFTVNGGEKVGIVGRTGAGKSSLTLALFRIIESAGGSILIDGQDISKLGLHALRSRLTIIPQDPVLFSGSLRMNLDPFERSKDEEVWTALEHAHLKAFVKGLTAGLNHEITEGGENLSVGQRQLVCLARALLRKTKVLILDEATAAVDLETDDLIQKTIRTEFKDCTVLTIAHRLNTILDSDKVIVLDRGQISEFASPNELLQNKKSAFYSMANDSGLI